MSNVKNIDVYNISLLGSDNPNRSTLKFEPATATLAKAECLAERINQAAWVPVMQTTLNLISIISDFSMRIETFASVLC